MDNRDAIDKSARAARVRRHLAPIALAVFASVAAGCQAAPDTEMSRAGSPPARLAAPAAPSLPPTAETAGTSNSNPTPDIVSANGEFGSGNGNGNSGVGSGNGNVGQGFGNTGIASGLVIDGDSAAIVNSSDGETEITTDGSEQVGRKVVSTSVRTRNGATVRWTTYRNPDGTASTETITRKAGSTIVFDASRAVHQTLDRSIADAGLQRVAVRSSLGSIELRHTATAGKIEVHADIAIGDSRITPTDAKRFAAAFMIESHIERGVLTLSAKPPANFPKESGFRADFTVGVPDNMPLTLHTGDGDIRVHDIGTTGAIAANTGSGAIEITDSGATVDASSGNGDVTVSSKSPLTAVHAGTDSGAIDVSANAADISASSENGSVSVVGGRDTRNVQAHSDSGEVMIRNCGGTITASSTNGAVRYAEGNGSSATVLTCTSDSGDVEAVLTDTTSLTSATLKSENGAVSFQAPPSASIAVSAQTDNGQIATDGMPEASSAGDSIERQLMGAHNGGRAPVTLRTDSGNISIRLQK